MSRLESLKNLYAVLEQVPSEELVPFQLFSDVAGKIPCCSFGHALVRTPGARDRYQKRRRRMPTIPALAATFDIDDRDVERVIYATDRYSTDRKEAVLQAVKELIEDARDK